MENSQEAGQFHFQPGFLPGFPYGGLGVGLVHFHQPADQAPLAVIRAALEQDLAVLFNHHAPAVQDQLPGTGQFPKFVNVIHKTLLLVA